MMIKKENSKMTHLIGIVSVLLLLTAAVFVGGVAAGDVAKPEVNSSAALSDAVNLLDTCDRVDVKVVDNFGLTESDTKNIVAKLVNVFINGSKNKTFTLDLNGYTISADRNGKSVNLSGEADITLSQAGVPSSFTAEIGDESLSAKFIYNDETISLDVHNVTVSLEPGDNVRENKLTILGGDPNDIVGTLNINGEPFTINEVSVKEQSISFEANVEKKHAYVGPFNDKEVIGTVKINEGIFVLSSNDFSFKADYDNAISATGMVKTGTVKYTPNGGEPAVVQLSNVEGTYGTKTKLSGAVTLMDDNLKLTRHIPVPSFVEKGYLNLNGHLLTINSDGKILSNTPKGIITITSTGKFDPAVLDHTNFKLADGFKWANDKKEIVINDAVAGLGEIKEIYSTIPVMLTSTTTTPPVGNIYGIWRVGTILAYFNLTAMGDYSGQPVTVIFELTAPASNPKVFHFTGGSWEVINVTPLGGSKYSFTTTSMSPFTVAEATYVGGGGGGGSGGGSSSVIPTITPTVTPTVTPTNPTVPTQGDVPTQQPKSPMPIFGVLAGLGAAALAGVVLRRK